MTESPSPDSSTGPTRSGKLVLIFVATPVFAACGFTAIVLVSDLLDYRILGKGDWGIVPWVVSQFLACVVLALALALFEAMRAGNLRVYTVVGIVTGGAAYIFASTSGAGRGFWMLPLQYGLMGYLLGWIAYRFASHRAPALEAEPDGAQIPEKET